MTSNNSSAAETFNPNPTARKAKNFLKKTKSALSKFKNMYNIRSRKFPTSPYNGVAHFQNDFNDGRFGLTRIKSNDVLITKSKRIPSEPVCFSAEGFKSNFNTYLLKSTLHGLRYIGERHLTLLERAFWSISVFLALVFAVYFINNIYDRWNTSPMIVSINPEQADLTEVPFPAITICNMNQARKTVTNNILKRGNPIDKRLLEALCNSNNESALLDVNADAKAGEWNYFKQFLINVTQPCNDLLASCSWKGELRNCDNLFNTALTDEGLCCTFNSIHREMMFRNPRDLSDLNITFPFPPVDWTPEFGYPPGSPMDGFPWRPIGSGANLGLSLALDANIDEYYCSSTSSVGFKILLHNPAETPKILDFGDFIAPGKEVRLVVKPRIYDANRQLKSISVNKRNCVFSDERRLVYYRTYTKKNCEMECEAKLTVEKCNCSQYFMPKNSSIRICGVSDSKCYVQLKVAIEDRLGINESSILNNINCDACYPACYELSYDKSVSTSSLSDSFDPKPEYIGNNSMDYFLKNMAVVHIYFVETSFIRYTKGELFGFTDFLSNTGGLLGLFLGFSFLSFVEIMYYLTLRIWCMYYKNSVKNSKLQVFPFSQ